MNIVKAVNSHKTATVAEIAEWLETSPATVRRDLTWLDEQGLTPSFMPSLRYC
ncbi:MAG: DeoR family transcriptional regulator [Ktedonobacteraceae bacterium]